MISPLPPRPCLAALLAVVLLAFTAAAQALPAQAAALLAEYQRIRPQLRENPFGIPVHVQSRERNGRLTAEVYGEAPFPLPRIQAALAEPSGWCALLALNLNAKACVHRQRAGEQTLILYMGRKFYQPPEQTYRMRYHFQADASTPGYFEASLSAADGPLGTRDYRIVLQAVTVPAGTLLHIRSGYRPSTASRLATRVYLATLGSGKIGFSRDGADDDGRPRYVEGIRGTLERATMRHYLALQTAVETQPLPAEERFEARIQRWFDLTERHHPQLYEMDKKEYLQAKRREHANQQRLQAAQTASTSEP